MSDARIYRITSQEDEILDDYDLSISVREIIVAFESVLGPRARAYPAIEGFRYHFGRWTCTVTGTNRELRLSFDGDLTRRRADQIIESIVRELEPRRGALDWATADGLHFRRVDLAGEVTSAPLRAHVDPR